VSCYQTLVTNGCSYMFNYTRGGGHIDLAQRLGIPNVEDLTISGSANSRILRTTLKHSYTTTQPTLYVLGMTFVSRSEIPIVRVDTESSFEGRWSNPQNQVFEDRWDHFWNRRLTEQYVNIKSMTEVYSLLDRTEDLMYNMLAVVDSLHSRGHQVVMYQQADDSYQYLFEHLPNQPARNPAGKLDLFGSTVSIIDKFQWCAVKYQHEHGVPKAEVDPALPESMLPTASTPEYMLKPAPGAYQVLNDFLVDYITHHKLLE
jgi:hypothetical protein